ncbi:MAG: type 1 glutamine amidotransferase [Deltaproteobacteria bacterium]|nr:type 1 glutamine amidotransferase [Deltaproteobacteria bacterium]
MKRLLVIDNGIWEDIYRPTEHWTSVAGCDHEAVRPPLGGFPDDAAIGRATHVVVTGSEASINGDDEWILRVCDLVRDLAARRVPILGSCFGHQLVVRALSGKEFVRASPTPEFGWVEVERCPEADADPLLAALPSPFHCFSAHFDEVSPLPDGWIRLARSGRCENAAVRRREGPVWGVQHHPEIDFENARVLMEGEMARMPPEACERMLAAMQPEPRDSGVLAALVAAFLRT